MPSLSSTSAAKRCTGINSGLPFSDARLLARWTASCALTVNLSQRIAIIFPLHYCHSERSEGSMYFRLQESVDSFPVRMSLTKKRETVSRLPPKLSSFARPDGSETPSLHKLSPI